MSKSVKQIRKELTELYNSHPFEVRKNLLGLGSVSTQLTTIEQIRILNKEAWKTQDKKLARWQKNIAESANKEFLMTNPIELNNKEEK